MVNCDMDELRSYLIQSGASIWQVIHSAIHLAASDHPKEFRERRVEIAETLFSRNLSSIRDTKNDHNSNANDHHRRHSHNINPNLILEEGEVRDGEGTEEAFDGSGLDHIDHIDDDDDDKEEDEEEEAEEQGNGEESDGKTCDKDGKRNRRGFDHEAEIDEETMVLREIENIKESIKDVDQPEKVILEPLQRLQYMQITVEALKSTEIGKHVNGLRKHSSRKVRCLVKELVKHWKMLVDKWVNSVRGVNTDAGAECGEFMESHDDDHHGIPSSLVDEDALLEGRASTGVDLSELFSFIEGGGGGRMKHNTTLNSNEPSVKDNLDYFSQSQSQSQSGSMQIPEERGSATRRDPPIAMSALKGKTSKMDNSHTSKSIPGNDRPLKGVSASVVVRTSKSIHDSGRKTIVDPQPHVNIAQKSSAVKTDKCLVDQKLENAKRKLHQGYQQAENAKKQRVVQVLDIPDLPKTGAQVMRGKPNPPTVQKSTGGHWSQNRKYTN